MFENVALFVTASETDGVLGRLLFRHISICYATRVTLAVGLLD